MTDDRATAAMVDRYHSPALAAHQCGSRVVQSVAAPLPLVWSIVRQFERPQAYKRFVKSCALSAGAGGPGSVREVWLVSGLPAHTSTERLDALDDDDHLMVFSIIGGDHRFANYRSTVTLHEAASTAGTVVIESYVVDVPAGNTKEDTCLFTNTIVRCNLGSLARLAEKTSSAL